MAKNLSGYTLHLLANTDLITETCYKCGVLFAMTVDYRQQRMSNRDSFHCPNGHSQMYTGATDAQKLREAQARETALRDQLEASIRDGELTRQAPLRDRQRFANGVCPCCRRSFENVRRHMSSQHPEYPATDLLQPVRYQCSCGRKFDSWRGLRTHQGHVRGDDWAKPGKSSWYSHLTVVDAK